MGRRADRRSAGRGALDRVAGAAAIRGGGDRGGDRAQAQHARLRAEAGRGGRGPPGEVGLLRAAGGAQALDAATAGRPHGGARVRGGGVVLRDGPPRP